MKFGPDKYSHLCIVIVSRLPLSHLRWNLSTDGVWEMLLCNLWARCGHVRFSCYNLLSQGQVATIIYAPVYLYLLVLYCIYYLLIIKKCLELGLWTFVLEL